MRCLKSPYLNTETLESLPRSCDSAIEQFIDKIKPIGHIVEVVEAIQVYCKELSVSIIRDLGNVFTVVGQECCKSGMGPMKKYYIAMVARMHSGYSNNCNEANQSLQ